jgi:hypothetical protein
LKFSILFTITPFLLPNNWVWFHDFAVCCYPPVALPTLPRFPSSVNKLSKLTLQLSQLSPPHQLKAFPSCSNPFLVYTLWVRCVSHHLPGFQRRQLHTKPVPIQRDWAARVSAPYVKT